MHSRDTSGIIKENNRIIVLILLTHGKARVALSMSRLNRTYNTELYRVHSLIVVIL